MECSLEHVCQLPVSCKKILIIDQKGVNYSGINKFGLSPLCVPITQIDIIICLKFQSNSSSNRKLFENVTKKFDGQTDAGQNKTLRSINAYAPSGSLSILPVHENKINKVQN